MNRYFMTVDIDGEFRQLEIPPHVVEIIRSEARQEFNAEYMNEFDRMSNDGTE
jgi:hypothetical protein